MHRVPKNHKSGNGWSYTLSVKNRHSTRPHPIHSQIAWARWWGCRCEEAPLDGFHQRLSYKSAIDSPWSGRKCRTECDRFPGHPVPRQPLWQPQATKSKTTLGRWHPNMHQAVPNMEGRILFLPSLTQPVTQQKCPTLLKAVHAIAGTIGIDKVPSKWAITYDTGVATYSI